MGEAFDSARSLGLHTLKVDELIVHDVPQRIVVRSGSGPVLSGIPSPLNNDLRDYFAGRLTQTLGRAASEVEYDSKTTSPAPKELALITQKSSALVTSSQSLARHLFNSQNGSNPGGLLVVGVAAWRDAPAVLVLKLEREEALLLNQKHVHGQITFDMEHLRNLMLNNRTRVFKAGLFTAAARPADLRGFVSDTQGGYGREADVAHFFLSAFLGCRYTEAPERTTQRFLNVVDEFINLMVTDPALKARYRIAAIAALQDRDDRLSPKAFSLNYLEDNDAQKFLELARERGLAARSFVKDTRLVRARVEKMALEWVNGLQLTGSADSFKESVDVRKEDDGSANVNIRGRLAKVK